MSVEILTVSLSDESIARLASEVARILGNNPTGTLVNQSPEPQRTQSAEVSQPVDDPWATTPGPTTSPATSSGAYGAGPAGTGSTPGAGGSAAAPPPSGFLQPEKAVKKKWGVELYQFPASAPHCECGQPAALVHKTSKAGKQYTIYNCAKQADDWRNACQFDEFPKRGK